jgi:hypothetical protein
LFAALGENLAEIVSRIAANLLKSGKHYPRPQKRLARVDDAQIPLFSRPKRFDAGGIGGGDRRRIDFIPIREQTGRLVSPSRTSPRKT